MEQKNIILLDNITKWNYIIYRKCSERNKKEVNKVKINKNNYELARAKSCKGVKDLEVAGISKATLCRALSGGNIRPETAGKIAKALDCDVTEIIETEN